MRGGQNIQTSINFEKGQTYINFDVGIDFQISVRMCGAAELSEGGV